MKLLPEHSYVEVKDYKDFRTPEFYNIAGVTAKGKKFGIKLNLNKDKYVRHILKDYQIGKRIKFKEVKLEYMRCNENTVSSDYLYVHKFTERVSTLSIKYKGRVWHLVKDGMWYFMEGKFGVSGANGNNMYEALQKLLNNLALHVDVEKAGFDFYYRYLYRYNDIIPIL